MELGCNIEADVNGEEIFIADKKILASLSRRLGKLFGKVVDSSGREKIIFHNFPGGAEGFELFARYCYSNGSIKISASNMVLLYSAAYFMEMNDQSSATNLARQTEKSLEEISYWTWPELLTALKRYQDILPASSSLSLLEKLLDCLVGKLAMPTVASPFTWSSGNSTSLSSSDISSSCSTRIYCSPATWWCKDLLFLNAVLLDRMIRIMIYQNLDHFAISVFLISYLKSRFLSPTLAERSKAAKVTINLLSLLHRNRLSFKGLFHILLLVSSLKQIGKQYILELERLIGSRLDHATVNHLLLPSHGKGHKYDVDFVLRLVRIFLRETYMISRRLKKVTSLVDSYILEVAPDIFLKPSKFAELVSALPDSARESSDKLYEAIDIYLQVHVKISEKEKLTICCLLSQEKLSSEASKQLARNSKYPSTEALKLFRNDQSKLNSLIHNQGFAKEHSRRQEDAQQILFSAKNLCSTETVDLVLQEMHPRATKLEKPPPHNDPVSDIQCNKTKLLQSWKN